MVAGIPSNSDSGSLPVINFSGNTWMDGFGGRLIIASISGQYKYQDFVYHGCRPLSGSITYIPQTSFCSIAYRVVNRRVTELYMKFLKCLPPDQARKSEALSATKGSMGPYFGI